MLKPLAVVSAAATGMQIDIGNWPEKLGFAGLTAFLVYWIVNKISVQLDEIARCQKEVTIELVKLVDAMRRHIGDEDSHQAKG